MAGQESDLPGYAREEVCNRLTEKYVDYINGCERNNIPVPFRVTVAEFKLCHKLFAPITFEFDAEKLHRSHPVFALGKLLADRFLDPFRKGNFIEIGGDFAHVAERPHTCVHWNGRDEARLIKAYHCAHDEPTREILGSARFGTPHRKLCLRGSENCTYAASVGVMNNVYDITMKDMYTIFDQHGLEIVHAVMMLPDEVAFGISGTSESGYSIRENGEDTIMSFECGSFAYQHKTFTWRDWCTVNVYNGEHFSLLIERVRNFGPMTQLIITRVHSSVKVHSVISSKFSSYYKVYDFLNASDKVLNECRKFRLKEDQQKLKNFMDAEIGYILIPPEVHAKVIQHAAIREDLNFRRQQVAAILKSVTSCVTIASQELQRGFNMTGRSFCSVVVALYLEACVYRQGQTKTIGKCIEFLKGESLLERVVNYLKQEVKEVVTGKKHDFLDITADRLALCLECAEMGSLLNTGEVSFRNITAQRTELEDTWCPRVEEGDCLRETLDYIKYGKVMPDSPYKNLPSINCVKLTDKEQLMVRGDEFHVQPELNLREYCKHSVGRKLVPVSSQVFISDVGKSLESEYKGYPWRKFVGNKTAKKLDAAANLLCEYQQTGFFFKKQQLSKGLYVACSSPGNDLPDSRVTGVNVTKALGDSKAVKFCLERQILTHDDLNLLCDKCVSSMPDRIYADYGIEKDQYLAYNQYQVLLNLLNSGKFFVMKIQDIIGSISNNLHAIRDLIGLIHENFLGVYNVHHASEIFVTNVKGTCSVRPHLLDKLFASVGLFSEESLFAELLKVGGRNVESDIDVMEQEEEEDDEDDWGLRQLFSEEEVRQCDACDQLANSALGNVREVNGMLTGDVGDVKMHEFSKTRIQIPQNMVDCSLKILNVELRDSEPAFRQINQKARECVSVLDPVDVDREIFGLVGVPGCGKTTTVIANINDGKLNGRVLVVTPYSRLTKEYRDKGVNSETFVSAFSKVGSYDSIVLDEVFAMSPGVLIYYLMSAKNIYLVGDPRQMANVDKARLYSGIAVKDILPWHDFTMNNTSFTVPLDIVSILNKKYGYNMKTYSRVVNSINFCYDLPKDQEMYCFTSAFERRSKSYRCVAKIQGERKREAHLMIESGAKPLIERVHGQFVVAISRHSETLHVRSQVPAILHHLFGDTRFKHTCRTRGPLDHFHKDIARRFASVCVRENTVLNADKFVNERGTFNQNFSTKVEGETDESLVERRIEIAVPEKVLVTLDAHVKVPVDSYLPPDEIISDLQRYYDPVIPQRHQMCNAIESVELAEEVMNKISPTLNQHEQFHGVHVQDFGPMQAKIKQPDEIMLDSERTVKRLGAPLRGRPTFHSDFNQTLHCAQTRYCSAPDKKQITAKEMFQSFYDNLEEVHCVTDDDIALAFAEQVVKIREKGEFVQSEMFDMDDYQNSTQIKFFLKQQVKADLKEESWLRYNKDTTKAGQGISAQPKIVNILCGAYVRALEKNVKKSLKKGNLFGYGQSPSELAVLIRKFKNPSHCGFECDVSEMDRQRDRVTDKYMDQIYELFDVPNKVVKFMSCLNDKWILDTKGLKVLVKQHFQSGRADTLLSNTLVSMGWFLTCFKVKDFSLALWQGDDVAIFAKKIVQSKKAPFLKVTRCPLPTFVGYIVVDGLTLDTPRAVCKLLNRTFNSDKDLEEYRLAVGEWLSILSDSDDYYKNALYVAKCYERFGVTEEDCNVLLSLLCDFAEGKLVGSIKDARLITNLTTSFLLKINNG
ncbi:RdRp [Wenling hepe-like virus 4]|uniref:RdRp n=1 Tax=Wenling hepe-like virus 4 TaxID=1923496 RepID=UPI00090C7E2B|nr:RdRp [Wenling hepe-like virus 4]APG77817.1 RdRp [Wenling hepe-like virus 4]